jgi:hypothetical protein
MLTDKQQRVLEVNRVGAVQLSQENALKKAIGYIFSNK